MVKIFRQASYYLDTGRTPPSGGGGGGGGDDTDWQNLHLNVEQQTEWENYLISKESVLRFQVEDHKLTKKIP